MKNLSSDVCFECLFKKKNIVSCVSLITSFSTMDGRPNLHPCDSAVRTKYLNKNLVQDQKSHIGSDFHHNIMCLVFVLSDVNAHAR